MSASVNFDPLARIYRALEIIAFGGDLERTRFCLLDRLAECRSILVLGEGDGRCLARLLRIAPAARIHCLDSSAAMIARAKARIARTADSERVTFECADALSCTFVPAHYDAVVTLFFLDCFDAETAVGLIDRIGQSLQPGALWLFADFVQPPRGPARWRARVWLAVLYAFFRWQTGLSIRALPPSEKLIGAIGFRREVSREFQWGLLRCSLFKNMEPRRLEEPEPVERPSRE